MDNAQLIGEMNRSLDSIRPYLIEDGGDVEVVSMDSEGNVKIVLHGNCRTCMLKNSTIKTGIETNLKSNFKEVVSIEEASI